MAYKDKQKAKEYRRQYYLKNKKKINERNINNKIKNKQKYNKRSVEYSTNYHNTLKGTVTMLFSHINRRAKHKKYHTNLDKKYLLKLIQNSKVELGDMLSFDTNSPSKASIDQIEPNNGYHRDNVQIIPAWLNFAYQDYDKNEVNMQITKYAEYLKNKRKE